MASVGRTRKNPPTQLRATLIQRSQPSGSGAICGDGHPPASPSATALPSIAQSRWQNRLARGAESSHPDAACSGGLAAATTATPAGSSRSPTVRSSTTRSRAACTAGGSGRDLVEEQDPVPGGGQALGPSWRREVDARVSAVVVDDRQSGEVGGFADGGDHRL